uniref:Uncharacterized protein n=1 Tax=Setaria digitata TaxID=48799 RepID=A0A915Q370_9BILA
MNDWEIGGTQNKWVCPSDRHLQLRAQLKSGWSVRTANARSTVNSKKNVITDSEKKHITAVLARAEERRLREQQRIGMIDRLEKMKARATGNGITQCYLCSTDFGLLAPKSYAAMCVQCRRYVCQKNCGVEAYDCVRRENIFLCKICSEYREVMWKKSGAWFYKKIPEYVKPAEDPESHSSPSYYPKISWQHYAKPETSSIASSSVKLKQPQKEQFSSEMIRRTQINSSWLRKSVQLSLSNGYASEDETADNSTSKEAAYSKANLRRTSTAISNRPVRIQKRTRANIVPVVNSHGTPSTSPRCSPLSHTDDLSQNQSSILLSEYLDSGAENLNQTVMIASADECYKLPHSFTEGVKHSNSSRASLITTGIQKIFPSSEIHNTTLGCLDREISPQMRKYLLPVQKESKTSKNSENTEHLFEDKLKKIFPLTMQTHEATVQCSQQEQLLVLSPNSTPSPSSPTPELPKHQTLNQELSPTSSTSSVEKSGRSLESLPIKPEQFKTDNTIEPSTFYKFAPDNRKVSNYLPMKGLLTTKSALSLQSSIAAELVLKDQAVRHAVSGSDIIILQNCDQGMRGSIQFTLRYSAQQMNLHVGLRSAKNLRAMDKNGFSDPYVKLYLIPGASKATKMVSTTVLKTLNPFWNEEFTYYGVTDEDRLRKSLRLVVLDRDRIGSDFLGEVRVPLKDLKNEEETIYNLSLEHTILPIEDADLSNERGKICLSLLYNVQQGSLYVTIKRCAELLGMDKTGFSDPYVKVSLLPLTNKTHRQKTSTKKRTLNPEFNETLTFVIPFKDLPKKTLQIDVFDKDVGKHDDYIGSILLSTSAKGERRNQWNSCIQNPGYEFEQWHKLEVIE